MGKFIARDLGKFTELDDFDQGCIGKPQDYDLNVSFMGETADEVIGKIADFLGLDPKDADRNVCDEIGRVEFGRTENADGEEMSKSEIAQWKRGKIKAWYAVYTAYIEELTPVKL